MRKLASVQVIQDLTPIPNADRIETAHVLGWEAVVKKGEYKAGDKCVYIEIDSLLPEDNPAFDFLKDSKGKIERIRTKKLRGQISQGLVMPMSILPEDHEVGDDVTKLLKIKKWEPDLWNRPADKRPSRLVRKYSGKWASRLLYNKPWTDWFSKYLFTQTAKSFPAFINRTDETRCLLGKTMINTNLGKMRISTIVNNWNSLKELLVLSYNEKEGICEYKPITAVQKIKCTETLLNIEFAVAPGRVRKNRVVCTPDHKFFSDGDFIEAQKLKVGDTISTFSQSYSQDVLPFIYGGILGDCGLCWDKRRISSVCRPVITFSQGEKQYEYLRLKQQSFGEDYFHIREGRSGYGSNKVFQGNLKVDETIYEALLADNAMQGHKFHLTPQFLSRITLLSIAIWYMDDGSLSYRDRKGGSPTIRLASYSFSKEENEMLAAYLMDKFGYEFTVGCHKQSFWGLRLRNHCVKKFLQDITKFIPMSMRYKTLPELEAIPFEGFPIYDKAMRLVDTKITNISKYKKGFCGHVYDITVQDNHNFFANNVLTHNCQAIPEVVAYYAGTDCAVTEKMDGSSITIWFDDKLKLHVASRNLEVLDTSNYFWKAVINEDIEGKLRSCFVSNPDKLKWLCLQGELCGPNIQGNKYKFKQKGIFFFNILYCNPVRYLSLADLCDLTTRCGLKTVPILDMQYKLPSDIANIVDMSKGESYYGNTPREGVVIRPEPPIIDHNGFPGMVGNRVSFKAINPEFLLKYKL